MVPPSSSPIMILVIILALVATAMASDLYDENVLYGGQRLSSYTGGQELRWEDYVLYLPTDCNLYIVKISSVSWHTNTKRDGILCFLHMQLDGNLVLYDVRNNVLWQSNTTAARPGENVLLLRPDGNAAIYGSPIWSTRKSRHPANPSASALERAKIPPSTKLGRPSTYARFVQNVLYDGESLRAGQELRAKSYRFIMNEDCILILYNDYDVLWTSGTNRRDPNCYFELKNGNLNIYDGDGMSVWQSGTERRGGDYVLIVQNTGSVVLYSKALWSKPNAVSSGLITTTSNSSYVAHQGRKMKIAMVVAGNQE